MLSQAAADGRLRRHRDFPFRCPAAFRQCLQPGWSEQVASFAELPGPAVVVFQDLDDPVAAATFGEVMCTTYRHSAPPASITSGAGRDLDQVEALNFPCFTSGTMCAHGYCQIVQINCRSMSAAS